MTMAMEDTAFGRVLGEFMQARGLEATPEEVVRLGYCARLDGKELLRDATRRKGTRPGPRRRQKLTGLADELGLAERERVRLALAYALEEYRQ